MNSSFGGSIKLSGESQYRQALQQIALNLRELSAQMKLTSATYEKNDKSMDALSAKSADLTNKLGLQKEQLSALKNQYVSMSKQYSINTEKHNELIKTYEEEKTKLDTIGKTLGTTSTEYQEQKKVVADLAGQITISTKNQDANAKSMTNMGIKIKSTEADIKKTENALEDLDNEMSKSRAEADAANSAYRSLQSTIEKQESKLKQLKDEYKNVVLEQGENSQSAKNLASQISILSDELNENKIKLNNTEKAADELSKSMDDVEGSTKGATGGFTVFKGVLANLVANTIQTAISKLKELASTTIQIGMNFDTAMSKVEAISGAVGDELSQLREKAKQMGATTKFTATEAAEAFNYMALAGWKTEDMLNGIDGVLNLAAASGADLATTSDIVTDALTAMGYSAADAGKLSDVMAAASANANTNVEMMGHTFQYVAPIVGALGYTMEDTAVAIGLMANAGIKAQKAGTSLRSILTRLSAPPKECALAMEALGISITNTDGTMKPLNEVIENLRRSFNGLSEAEQAQYAKNLAGQEAISGLLAIINSAPSDYDKLTKAVENSSGAAKKMADTMIDNAEGGLKLLKSNIEGVQIAIYEKFEPALRKGIEMLNKLTDSVRFVVDHSGEFSAALMAMAAGVAAYVSYSTAIQVMTKGWKSLVVVQKAVTAAQWLMNAAMAASPIGVVVAAVAALVSGFIVLWNTSEDFRNFWIGLWESIKKAAQPIVEAISGWFSKAWEDIKEIWDVAVIYFQTIWDNIKEVFSVVSTVLGGYFKVAWESIKAIWDISKSYFKAIWDTIAGIFSVVKNVLTGNWRDAWEGIKGIVNTWVGFFKNVWGNIKNVFGGVKDYFKSIFSAAWAAIKNVFSNWGNFFGNLWNIIKNKFSSTGTIIANAIGGAVKSGINGIISMIENTINSAIGIINGAINLINKIPGVNIGGLSKLNLPKLAKGGVLEDGVRAVIAGEDGAEAIVPLEKNTKWIKMVANQLQDSFTENKNLNVIDSLEEIENQSKYNMLIDSFKRALSEMKIEMDSEIMGKFVEKTVSNAIYS